MLWMGRCTLHCHCYNCHCHYQKCQYWIHLLLCLWSNRHPILHHRATCVLQQMLKIVVGEILVVAVMVMVAVLVFGSFVAGKRNWLYFGNNSQEMPEGGDYKYFLKNSLNKADLIRRFSEFMKREVLHLHLD